VTRLADAFSAFLIDLDGVVWRGEREIPGASAAIAELRELNKRVVFVSNNSSRTPKQVAVRLMRAKIPTEIHDIVTSAHAVVEELNRIDLLFGARVHVCGSEALAHEVAHARFTPTKEMDAIAAVVVGLDRAIGFEDIRRASDLARTGIPFIASNDDATYPTEDGLIPGAGAILAAVERAAGRRADVVGKPKPTLFRLALERAGVPAERALFLGDRPDTDIAGARAAGIPCALVLTGVTGERDLGRIADVPGAILDELSDVLLPGLPRPTIERRDGSLVAVEGSDLATLRCARQGTRAQLLDVSVPTSLDRAMSWRVVRMLLVEALAGAVEIEAGRDLRPYLDRIGVDADPQRPLFGSG
jgi:glycerol-1-phosphatase